MEKENCSEDMCHRHLSILGWRNSEDHILAQRFGCEQFFCCAVCLNDVPALKADQTLPNDAQTLHSLSGTRHMGSLTDFHLILNW